MDTWRDSDLQTEKDEQPADTSLSQKLSIQAPAVKDTLKTTRDRFKLRSATASGPFRSFNPTRVRLKLRRGDHGDEGRDSEYMADSDLVLLWRARDNRKGRRSVAVPAEDVRRPSTPAYSDNDQRPSSRTRDVLRGTARMFTTFPYWDMTYWVAFWFVLGSAIWVANGFMAWLPVAFPSTEAPGETKYGVGLTTILGVLAFQVGVTLEYLEAVNDGSWHGSMMRRLVDGHDDISQKDIVDQHLQDWVNYMNPLHRSKDTKAEKVVDIDPEAAWNDATKDPRSQHDLQERRLSVFQQRRGAVDMGVEEEGSSHELLPFRWWPTWRNLKEHHAYEIGFVAATAQFIGGTIFIITGIVGAPGVIDSLKPYQENLSYWLPQVIASIGFIVASALFMIEVQPRWWKPQPNVLGWHIGAWALIGSIGFEYVTDLCGIRATRGSAANPRTGFVHV